MILYPNPKINIGLRVLSKRPDGYHDIVTLFVPYDGVKDVLEVVPSAFGSLRMFRYGKAYDGDPMDDICIRAWRLLSDDFDLPPVDIHLYKNIPVGAGLGGGSSDGASTLVALNGMFSLGLDNASLRRYAAMLGSDCAFFIDNRPMMARGRGDELYETDIDLGGYRIELVTPDIAVSTAQAYRGVVPCGVQGDDLEELLHLPVEQWKGRVVNDFEPTVFAAHPSIARLKEDFYRRGAVYASMSGSGSSVFGLFPVR